MATGGTTLYHLMVQRCTENDAEDSQRRPMCECVCLCVSVCVSV